MRRIAILLWLCFVVVIVEAQENKNDDEPQVKTLLGKYNEIKGFGALDFKLTDVASRQALVVGAYGGVIVNKQIMLGLGWIWFCY